MGVVQVEGVETPTKTDEKGNFFASFLKNLYTLSLIIFMT